MLCNARALLVLKMSVRKDSKPAYFAFIQFMECTEPFDDVIKAMGCSAVECRTDDGVDLPREVLADSKTGKSLRVGEWL